MTYARTSHAPAVGPRPQRPRLPLPAACTDRRFGPGDAAYAEACRIWNAMIERRPALVVRPRGAADIAACIAFVRGSGLPLSIRGGGHNIAGTALCDGGVMIDFSTRQGGRGGRGDPRVRVQPGATWADVDRATQPFGLVVPGGIVSATGVAGFTLGGGFGWVSRRHGFAADNLRAVEIVTADGEVRRASADENADLFWAIRGGGGNFGVVTAFEFEAQPHGPEVVAGLVLHPVERAKEVLALFREATAAAPDGLCYLLIMRKAPPLPILPPEVHGAPVVGIAVCHSGLLEEGEELVAPLKRFGQPLADTIGRKPFVAHQQFLDSGQPFGRRYYWKSDYLDRAARGRRQHGHRPRRCDHLAAFGGAVHAPGRRRGAASGRRDRGRRSHAPSTSLNVQGAWEDAGGGRAPRRVGAGLLVGDAAVLERRHLRQLPDRGRRRGARRAAYWPGALCQARPGEGQVRSENLFRSNQNIRPASAA